MSINALDSIYQEKCRAALSQEQTKSLSETVNWEHVDRTKVHADWDVLYKEIAKIIDTSNAADSNVQALIDQHYKIACRFYTPSKEAYIGMALFYGENGGMKDFHNAYHPKMVAFLGDAICAYANDKL